jgi:hypothetical protein
MAEVDITVAVAMAMPVAVDTPVALAVVALHAAAVVQPVVGAGTAAVAGN